MYYFYQFSPKFCSLIKTLNYIAEKNKNTLFKVSIISVFSLIERTFEITKTAEGHFALLIHFTEHAPGFKPAEKFVPSCKKCSCAT